jgi:hypothetical protein
LHFFQKLRKISSEDGKEGSVPIALKWLALMQCNLHDAQFFGFFLLQLRLCQKDVV